MKLKIAICDDEQEMIDQINEYLCDYMNANNLEYEVFHFINGEELIHQDVEFGLIFLDIEMEGMNGIQTAQHIRKKDKNTALAYVTSHSEYALKSFTVHPFDFAVKPVDKKRLFEIMDSFITYNNEKIKEHNLMFKKANSTVYLNINDIYYFEYTKSRTIIAHMKQGEEELRGSISEILNITKSHNFVSPHKSFVVNLAYVKEIIGYDVIMSNNVAIPIAQRRKKGFNLEMINYYHDSLL